MWPWYQATKLFVIAILLYLLCGYPIKTLWVLTILWFFLVPDWSLRLYYVVALFFVAKLKNCRMPALSIWFIWIRIYKKKTELEPAGCISVFGPATAATWWPKNGSDNAGNIKWDTISQQYIWKLRLIIVLILGCAVLLLYRSLRFVKGLINVVRPGLDHHFADNAENT